MAEGRLLTERVTMLTKPKAVTRLAGRWTRWQLLTLISLPWESEVTEGGEEQWQNLGYRSPIYLAYSRHIPHCECSSCGEVVIKGTCELCTKGL